MQRRKTSKLWSYFREDDVSKIAICNFCKKSISYKSTTSNLKLHLKRKHLLSYNSLNDDSNPEPTAAETQLRAAPSNPTSSPSSSYSRLASALPRPPIRRQGNFTASIPRKEQAGRCKREKHILHSELAQAVERYPDLYRQGGGNLDEGAVRALWEHIGTELQEPADACRKKWEKLRRSFMRKVKEAQNEEIVKVPGYMEHMAFLTPHISVDDVPDHLSDASSSNSSDWLDEHPALEDEPLLTAKEEPRASETTPARRKRKRSMEFVDTARRSEQPSVLGDEEKDARKHFLLSLEPDVRNMSTGQMRKFKRKVMELVEDVLDEDI